MTTTKARRDTYRDVGEATRVAIERAMPRLNLTEAKVLLGIVHHLTTRSKLSDSIANSQLRDVTGLEEKRVRAGLKGLAALGVIDLVPGGSEPGKGRRAAIITIPTPGESDPGSESTPVASDPGSKDTSDPGSETPSDPGSLRPPSEKFFRENPTEGADGSAADPGGAGEQQPVDDPAARERLAVQAIWKLGAIEADEYEAGGGTYRVSREAFIGAKVEKLKALRLDEARDVTHRLFPVVPAGWPQDWCQQVADELAERRTLPGIVDDGRDQARRRAEQTAELLEQQRSDAERAVPPPMDELRAALGKPPRTPARLTA